MKLADQDKVTHAIVRIDERGLQLNDINVAAAAEPRGSQSVGIIAFLELGHHGLDELLSDFATAKQMDAVMR